MHISITHEFSDPAASQFEIVERKGRGHPDTLADRLAENLSRAYSSYSRERFGTILRHQFDKLSLMGGKCDVRFGGGNFRSPIRLLINGRVTQSLGDSLVAFRDLLVTTAASFLTSELRNFDFNTDCRIMLETASHSTRGMIGAKAGTSPTHFRFRPRTLADLPEYSRPMANDTAVGCAWAPFTPTEAAVVEVERTLTSDESRSMYPWLGSDAKLMGCRLNDELRLTISVPQISTHVGSNDEYVRNYATVLSIIESTLSRFPFRKVEVTLNPGDDLDQELLYLRLTGSCIESGDEGQVNRGNRLGGTISSRRPFSIEGLSGKNPAYHAGKIYSAVAWDIANAIWTSQCVPCEVYIVSQIDRALDDPWVAVINAPETLDRADAEKVARELIGDIRGITRRILEAKYPLV
jgi:S-adenosylmethionine synthetase